MGESIAGRQLRRHRGREILLLVSTCGVLLASHATVGLAERTALGAQAVGILAFTVLAAGAGLRRPRWSHLTDARTRPLLLGVACYAACGMMAGIVGLARANEATAVAGQVFAMGMLPVGALVLWCLYIRGSARILTLGVVAAVALGASMHLVHWIASLLRQQLQYRFYLGNNVSVLGPSLLGLLLALALLAVPGRWRRWGGIAAVLLAAFIVGAGARSMWLVAPVTVALFVAASGLARRAAHPSVLLPAAAAVGACAAALATVAWYVEKPRPNLLPDNGFTEPSWRFPPGVYTVPEASAAEGRALAWAPAGGKPLHVSADFPVKGGRAYLLRVCLRSESQGEARVFLWFEAPQGGYSYVVLRSGLADGWFDAEQAGVSPATAVRAHIAVSLKQGGSGEWLMRRISVGELGHPILAILHQQRAFWFGRIASLIRLNPGDWRAEKSFRQRFGETGRLLQLFRDAPVAAKLLGNGLGARYDFKTRREDRPNYIHNFYAFLLYKTGIVGTVLVLAAMSLWIGFTFVAARRARDPWRRAFLWAVFSAWIGYAVWSLACPEILDFRMAPIWGFVIAVTGMTDREEREAQEALEADGGVGDATLGVRDGSDATGGGKLRPYTDTAAPRRAETSSAPTP